eukprot:m.24224 g.24224  ORF g.24224 m.24224 type:complete len:950 (+) comp7588_c0_seq1:95-2944(+)
MPSPENGNRERPAFDTNDPLVPVQRLPTGQYVFLAEGEPLAPGASLVYAKKHNPEEPALGRKVLYTANQPFPTVVAPQPISYLPPMQPPMQPQQIKTLQSSHARKKRHYREPQQPHILVEQRSGGRRRSNRNQGCCMSSCCCCCGNSSPVVVCSGPQAVVKKKKKKRIPRSAPTEISDTTYTTNYDFEGSALLGYFDIDIPDNGDLVSSIRAKLTKGKSHRKHKQPPPPAKEAYFVPDYNYVPTDTEEATNTGATNTGNQVVHKVTRTVDEWSRVSGSDNGDYQDELALLRLKYAKSQRELSRLKQQDTSPNKQDGKREQLRKLAYDSQKVHDEVVQRRDFAKRNNIDSMRTASFKSGTQEEPEQTEPFFVETPVMTAERRVTDDHRNTSTVPEITPTPMEQSLLSSERMENFNASKIPQDKSVYDESGNLIKMKSHTDSLKTAERTEYNKSPALSTAPTEVSETFPGAEAENQTLTDQAKQDISAVFINAFQQEVAQPRVSYTDDSDQDTRIQPEWNPEETALCFQEAGLVDFANIVKQHAFNGRNVLDLDNKSLGDLNLSPEEQNIFYFFAHSPGGLPSDTWSVLQVAAWLADHKQPGAAQQAVDKKVDGNKLLTMKEDDFQAIGVTTNVMCAKLARKAARRAPTGFPGPTWDRNDVQAWILKYGYNIQSDLNGLQLQTCTDEDLLNLGITDSQTRSEMLDEISKGVQESQRYNDVYESTETETDIPDDQVAYSEWTTKQAVAWLKKHDLPAVADFVIRKGLTGADLLGIEREELQDHRIPGPEIRAFEMLTADAARAQWTTTETVEWLMSHGLAEVANFFEYNSLTGADLLDVTDDELMSGGVSEDQRERFNELTMAERTGWTQEETFSFLKRHNLDGVAQMFLDLELSGADMPVIKEEDMDAHNIDKAEQEKFLELVDLGGADIGRGRPPEGVYYPTGEYSFSTE